MADRRPLTSRDTRWAKALASALVRMRVQPNAISIGSIFFGLFGGAAFVGSRFVATEAARAALLLIAAICIQGRLLCNLLDGMVAVEGKMGSKSGEVYNDLPDRIADVFIIVGAGYAIVACPWGAAIGWLAAVLAVATAYVRVLGAALGVGHDFRGPMAKPHRMATLTVAAIVEIVTAHFGYRDWALTAALALIVVGAVIACARRATRIVTMLEAR